jgi:type VI secretion system secreted protein Hcp
MPIYLKYGSVQGSVTEEGHKNWIELNSFQFGVGRGISSPTGSQKDRDASAPSFSEITCSKQQDEASLPLLEASWGGSEAQDAEIHFVRTENKKLDVYLKYKLSDVLISGYSVSSGGDRPTESLSLNYAKIEFAQDTFDTKNKSKQNKSTTYDLAAGKQV